MRALVPALATAVTAMAFAGQASAAPCKDAKGRFTKCPASAAAKPVRCKDDKGRFATCGTPGAKPR